MSKSDKLELTYLNFLRKKLQKEIYPKHSIREMDLSCPECEAAIFIAFINKRTDFLKWIKNNEQPTGKKSL